MWAAVAPESFGGFALAVGILMVIVGAAAFVPPDRMPIPIVRPGRSHAAALVIVGIAFIAASRANLPSAAPASVEKPAGDTEPPAPLSREPDAQHCAAVAHRVIPSLMKAIQAGQGEGTAARFGPYGYRYTQLEGCTVALFQPDMLPRRDDAVIPAIQHVIKTAYGDDVSDVKPGSARRAPANVITFSQGSTRYDVLTIKEGTGEVHTLVAWSMKHRR